MSNYPRQKKREQFKNKNIIYEIKNMRNKYFDNQKLKEINKALLKAIKNDLKKFKIEGGKGKINYKTQRR